MGVAAKTHWDIDWVDRETDWEIEWVDRETLKSSRAENRAGLHRHRDHDRDPSRTRRERASPRPAREPRHDPTGGNTASYSDALGEAHPALETASPDSIRAATLTGIRWGVVARVGIETASFLSMIVLARLVSPADFGHAATALAIVAIANGMTVESFGTPLVQRKEVSRAHIETSLFLSLASGLLLSCLVYFLAPLSTDVFGEKTVSLIQLASPAFFAVSLSAIPQALQQRRLNFRTTSVIQLASLAVGLSASVGLALLGMGARAVVLGQVLILFAAAVMFVVVTPLVVPRWHRRESRQLAGFGSQTTLSSLLFSAYSNVDYVVVSAQLGARATGYYWRAFQIGGVYQGKISQIMLSLALPVYSRTRDLSDMRRVRRRIVQVHAAVIFPLLATYVVVAPVVVPIVFGKAWIPTVVPSQILAFAGMVFALGTGGAAVTVAAGRPGVALANNAVSLCAYFAVVFAFARDGLTVLCLAIVALNTIGYLGTYYVVFDRMLGIPMRQLGEEVAPALLSLIPLFACAIPVAQLLTAASTPPVLWVAAVGSTAIVAYTASVWLFFPRTRADLALMVTHVFRGRRAPASDSP